MLTPEEIMTIKESIYAVLTDREIIISYLGLTNNDINYLLTNTNNRVSNPLRVDVNASLGIRSRNTINGEKLIIKDFADPSYNGDVFDVIGFIKGYDVNTRDGFINICQSIMSDLILNNGDIAIIPASRKTIHTDKIIHHNDTIPFVTFSDNGWSNEALKFWYEHTNSKAFTKNLFNVLKLENVYVPNQIFSNEKEIYRYNPNDACYVYYYGNNHVGNSIIKAYFPFRNRGFTVATTKFFTNDTNIFRSLQTNVETATKMIMTKSMKDALFIRTFLNFAGLSDHVDIHYVHGEENYLSKQSFDSLTANYDTVIWFMDFDKTGVFNTFYHMQFNPKVIPLFIPSKEVNLTINELTNFTNKINNRFNTNYIYNDLEAFIKTFTIAPYLKGVKDFSDLLTIKSLKSTVRYFKVLSKGYLKELVTIYAKSN